MSATVFTYFNMKARGDAINMTLELVGEKYEEKRINMDEWPKVKSSGIESGLLPFGQVPALHIDDMDVVQTGAIIRYLGRKYKMISECPKENLFAEMYMDGVVDFFNKFIGCIFSANKEENLKNFYANDYPMFMKSFDRLLEKYEGPFILGEKVTVYDAPAFAFFDQIIPKDSKSEYKNVDKFMTAFAALPAIKNYLESGRRPAY